MDYCKSVSVYEYYLTALADTSKKRRLELGCNSALMHAKLTNINFYLWMKDLKTDGPQSEQLELVEYHEDRTALKNIHLLYICGFTHFKLLSLHSVLKKQLKTYYQANTTIRLPVLEIEQLIEQSYVNLALVDEAEQRIKEQQSLRTDQAEVEIFGSLSNKLLMYEDVYRVTQPVQLSSLFSQSRQVIVLGRAGIGKSTFCKYITYQWGNSHAWSEFDAMYWLPLRHLRYCESLAA